MNHNIAAEKISQDMIKGFVLFQMQHLFKCYQLLQPQLPPVPEPLQAVTKKCGARDMAWQEEEDSILLSYIKQNGPKNWSKIATKINYEVFNGQMLRKGKHCRERWLNHLDPTLNKSTWTDEEDRTLAELQKEHGNSWSLIAKYLPGRTENSVRNRWKCLYRKGILGNKVI